MKVMKRIGLIAIIGTMGYFNAKAQSDSTLSLSLLEAQNHAIEHFFQSKNAALDIEAARKKILETTAIGLPQISASADYQYVLGDIPEIDFTAGMGDMLGTMFDKIDENANAIGNDPLDPDFVDGVLGGFNQGASPIAPRNTFNYGVTVSQLIFSGEYIVGLQAAKVYKTFAQENHDKIKVDLRESIAGTYFTLLILDANLDVIEKTLDNLRLNLDHTSKMFEAGLVQDTDVDQLSLTVKRTENDLASLKNQIQYMNRMFKYQIGLEAQNSVRLTDQLSSLIALNIIDENAYQFSLDENIDYQILSTQQNLQKLNWNREKTAYMPQLSGFYQYSDKTNKADLDFTLNHIVGINIRIPIFESGSRMAKVSQARIEYEQALNMKEQEAQRLILTSEQTKWDYQTALNKYYNEKENFELSEKVLNHNTEQYKQGFVSSLELSLVNNQFLQAQLSYSQAIQELLNAKIALDKAHNRL